MADSEKEPKADGAAGGGAARSGAQNPAQNPAPKGETPGGGGQGAQGAGAQTPDGKSGDKSAPAFDQWLADQDEGTRTLVSAHLAGLKGALESERTERRQLAKQLRDLSAKAEEGSELRSQLDKLTRDMEAVSRRAAFYEAAPADLTNVRLAFAAAAELGALGADGKADWAKLRELAPELFRRQTPPQGNAGSGAAQMGRADRSMNAYIRTALGRGG